MNFLWFHLMPYTELPNDFREKTPSVRVEEDQVIPPSYAKRFADAIGGETTIKTIAGAGHLADLDAPEAAGEAVLGFLQA